MDNQQKQKVVAYMPNKNDLRFIKTEKLIRDTYLELKQKSHTDVKVTKLCETALINKTTFYAHYDTIEALHECVCKDMIEKILDETSNVDCASSDTRLFVTSIVQSLQSHRPLLRALFAENEAKEINLIEDSILHRNLNNSDLQGKEMEIIFAIGGAARLLMQDQSEERMEKAIQLIQKVIH